MLTQLVILGSILFAFPAALPALELSAAQENFCVRKGSFAVSVGESRERFLYCR